MLFRICTGLAAATAVLATGSPVLAAAGGSRVVLTYTAEAGYATAVKLTCDPAGGAHPQPVQACAALTRTGANPARLKPADRYCFLLYKPITARLSGTWRGRTVKWTHTYGNSCEMNRATGVLFAF
ncbi:MULTISPECIES: SSI family serine proteinase inhibitor [Actinoplanes]|uniref:Serine protease n=2 Tax=Actinoplanes TaxID=1865 RepID=A0A101JDP8_9ACTN|nr:MULTISPECIES: SSI family serine proteinase inhibitor [Actinoplanes]KUL24918.1 serine protease [Actinoplanes awajinensis subsp. mycoplanecinus]GIE64967.1 protease [Actinoplanes palleronii]